MLRMAAEDKEEWMTYPTENSRQWTLLRFADGSTDGKYKFLEECLTWREAEEADLALLQQLAKETELRVISSG